MNYLKSTALMLLALVTSTSFAGTMGPVCVEGNVTIPCERAAWDFGAQALYLKPTFSSDFLFASFTSTSNATQWKNIVPNWGWGFKLNGSYYFNTGNDINLSWYHLDHTTNLGAVLNDANAVTVPSFLLSGGLSTKWDSVNAELAQNVHFGETKNVRFHGGAQYAQFSENFNTTAAGFGPETIYMKYSGFGPRVGADLNYGWGHGFGIYANAASALLVGNNKFNTSSSGVIDSAGFSSHSSSTVLVPQLEGKLGATYTYVMTRGDLSLDVGYMWLDYINSLSFLTSATGTGGTLSTQTDFSLSGPYVGLKWIG